VHHRTEADGVLNLDSGAGSRAQRIGPRLELASPIRVRGPETPCPYFAGRADGPLDGGQGLYGRPREQLGEQPSRPRLRLLPVSLAVRLGLVTRGCWATVGGGVLVTG
jgi:hypothetical protein